VPIDFFYLDGTSGGSDNRPTLGVPTAAAQTELYSSNPANSIGNPAFGGDGYVYYDYYNGSGVLIGYARVAIADLDNGNGDNVSDGIAAAMNSGDPGYAPTTVSADVATVAPQPTIVIDDGKYKLTDGAEDDDAGFVFDAFGNEFPAKIRYYPYDATNAVNDANLDLPSGYGDHGFTRAEMEAGIDKSFYDTNYPGVDIVFMRYNWRADALGAASDVLDTEAPVADQASLPTLTAQCEITSLTPPTATDNVDGTITGTTTTTLPITASTTIVWTYTDSSGNFSTQNQEVEIEDTVDPVAATQNIQVDLAGNSSVNIVPSDVNNGSSDNCGIESMTLSQDTFTAIGNYTVDLTVTDYASNSDMATANVEVIDSTVGINEQEVKGLGIYPNPTSGQLSLQANEPIKNVLISDVLGKQVFNGNPNNTKINLNLNQLTKGIYFVRVKTDNAMSVRKLVVK
jgi:hypothetical protein